MDKAIKITNVEKITEAIKAAEGRATVRTITHAEMIDAISTVERKLSIPKKYLDGISITVDYNAQSFPNAYKYLPESTHFDAINKKGIWYITAVYRAGTRGRSNAIAITRLPDVVKAEIIKSHTSFAV